VVAPEAARAGHGEDEAVQSDALIVELSDNAKSAAQRFDV
jgi:hypothetical protein